MQNVHCSAYAGMLCTTYPDPWRLGSLAVAFIGTAHSVVRHQIDSIENIETILSTSASPPQFGASIIVEQSQCEGYRLVRPVAVAAGLIQCHCALFVCVCTGAYIILIRKVTESKCIVV